MTNQSELLLMFIVLPWSLEDDTETSFSSSENRHLLTAESHSLQHSEGNTYSSVITWREWRWSCSRNSIFSDTEFHNYFCVCAKVCGLCSWCYTFISL